MRVLNFKVSGQSLSKNGDFSGIVAGTKGYLRLSFDFDPEWESEWAEGETEIKQAWKLVDDPVYPDPEPTPEERISNLETTTDELKTTSDDIILMMADLIGGEK